MSWLISSSSHLSCSFLLLILKPSIIIINIFLCTTCITWAYSIIITHPTFQSCGSRRILLEIYETSISSLFVHFLLTTPILYFRKLHAIVLFSFSCLCNILVEILGSLILSMFHLLFLDISLSVLLWFLWINSYIAFA